MQEWSAQKLPNRVSFGIRKMKIDFNNKIGPRYFNVSRCQFILKLSFAVSWRLLFDWLGIMIDCSCIVTDFFPGYGLALPVRY
jgi:hypothetical protein